MSATTKKLKVGTVSVNMSVWTPPTGSALHAVVVAYGASGMDPPFNSMIEGFCRTVAAAGYLVLLPHYFQSTGTHPGLDVVCSGEAVFRQWVEVLTTAAEEARASLPAGKLAFVGFSLGGNLALNAALAFPATCVIDYFGPVDIFNEKNFPVMPNAILMTKARAAKLPPLLIHQGGIDYVVSPEQSTKLAGWCLKSPPTCTLLQYEKSGHPDQHKSWKDEDDRKATEQSIQFLKLHLQ